MRPARPQRASAAAAATARMERHLKQNMELGEQWIQKDGGVLIWQRQTRLTKGLFGKSPAVQVVIGIEHTVVLLTAVGCVYICDGRRGQLGHGDTADNLVLTQVVVEHF